MPALRTLARFLGLAFAVLVWIGSECGDDGPTGIEQDAEFQSTLTGPAERPEPVTTDARGRAFFDSDGDGVRFLIEVEDIQSVTLAHVHFGQIDVAGPIVVELFNASETPVSFEERETLAEGTFTAADIQAVEGIATLDDLLEAMQRGNTYVNVHTTGNPEGEIRGQINFAFPPD